MVGGGMGWGMVGWVGFRVGFININDMYNNDVGQGVGSICLWSLWSKIKGGGL